MFYLLTYLLTAVTNRNAQKRCQCYVRIVVANFRTGRITITVRNAVKLIGVGRVIFSCMGHAVNDIAKQQKVTEKRNGGGGHGARKDWARAEQRSCKDFDDWNGVPVKMSKIFDYFVHYFALVCGCLRRPMHTRCRIFSSNSTSKRFAAGLYTVYPDPLGELKRSARPPCSEKGSKRREGRGLREDEKGIGEGGDEGKGNGDR